MEEKGYVNFKFIVFLKATLGKMVGTKVLDKETINYHFWETWPKKFYNIKSYDSSKEDLSRLNAGEHQVNGQEHDNSPHDYAPTHDHPHQELSPSILAVK